MQQVRHGRGGVSGTPPGDGHAVLQSHQELAGRVGAAGRNEVRARCRAGAAAIIAGAHAEPTRDSDCSAASRSLGSRTSGVRRAITADEGERAIACRSGEWPDTRELLQHAGALYRLARRLCRADADAEDLVQETYARAVSAIAHFTSGTDLRPWLFRILRNAWLDARRTAARHRTAAEGDEGLCSEDAGPAPLRGDDDLARMRCVVASEIEAALRTLGPDARALVVLDVEGCTETEMAEIMECPLGTVKSRLSRARALLRERLADYRR